MSRRFRASRGAGQGDRLRPGPLRLPAREERNNGDAAWQFVVRVQGVPMRAVMDQVLATIKQGGYRPADLAQNRKAPFALSEESGVRLGLLMLAVKPTPQDHGAWQTCRSTSGA